LTANLKLVFFAKLREDLGTSVEELALPAEVTTVAGLRAHLLARGGAWATTLAQGRALRVAVNREMAEPTTPVHPGDEVAFFPPVTGG
jgi:molybdopterin synthase sulfur carrier subunit